MANPGNRLLLLNSYTLELLNSLTLHPIRIHQNLPRQSALQQRKRILEFLHRRALAKQRLQVQPPRLQQRRHLHPRLIHPTPVNPLHRCALENHIVHQVQRHRLGRNSQQRRTPSRPQRSKSLLHRRRIPRHFQQHFHSRPASLRLNLRHRISLRRIHHHIRTHFLRHRAPLLISLGRKHGRASTSLGHRNGHQPNRPAARNQHRLPRNRAGQHRMHRVSQWVQDCPVMFRNRGVQLPNVRFRNFHELRERAILVNPDNPQILADMRFAQPALVTVAAVDVHLCANKIPRLHGRHFFAGSLHNSAKFVPQRYRRLDSPLRPPVPPVYMQISPANRGRAHPHQHLARSNRRHRRIFKGKPARSVHLAQGFHRRWHGKAAPGRPIAMLAYRPRRGAACCAPARQDLNPQQCLILRFLNPITSPVPQPQSSPTPPNTPSPIPATPAHIPPKPNCESPARSSSHPQNSTLHTRTLPRRPTIPHNSVVSASPRPPFLHAPRNSHTRTRLTGLSAQRFVCKPPRVPALAPDVPRI